jgi:outer membrane protein OmpA-like peptidoglycan-associated protein
VSALALLSLLALGLPADAPTAEGSSPEETTTTTTTQNGAGNEPEPEPHYFAISADFFGEFVGKAIGGEVRASVALASIFDVGAGVSIGSSPGILITGRVHLPYSTDRRLRPFLQARAAIHPVSKGYGGGLFGGLLIEAGPGRLELGAAAHLYAPVAGYLPYAVFAMGGYEFDVYPGGGHVAYARLMTERKETITIKEKTTVRETVKEIVGATLIRGKVHDLDDKPVTGNIKLTGGDLPSAISTTASEFSFPVTPGDYQVTVEAPGYLVRGARVTIQRGEQQVLDITLREVPKKAVAVLTRERVEILQTIQFEFNAARILPESYFILDAVVDILLRHPEVKQVRVEGHTDNVGGADFNQRLSEARAQSVMKYLIDKGVDPSRLRGQGFGLSRPIADNKTEDGRAKNRRVRFEIVE